MSQKTYNKAQCLKLLKVDAKTFDKWLVKANITPIQDEYDTRQKLLTYEQVCLLADQHKRSRPPLPTEDVSEPEEVTPGTLQKRIDALEQVIRQGLDALQREMAGLAQRITPQELPPAPAPRAAKMAAPTASASTPAATTTPPRLTRVTRRKRQGKARKKLPATLVPLATFRQLHNVSEKAVENAVQREKLAVVRGAWLYQHRFISVAIDRQGQRQFYELFSAREGFQQCDRCDHAL